MSRTAQIGDGIRIAYECRNADGAVLESVSPAVAAPLVLGDGSLLPALELALVGVCAGARIDLMLEPGDAFGPRLEEVVVFVPNEMFPGDVDPEVGEMVEIQEEGVSGEPMQAVVVSVEEDGAVVDGNHPLAGECLWFSLELVAFEGE